MRCITVSLFGLLGFVAHAANEHEHLQYVMSYADIRAAWNRTHSTDFLDQVFKDILLDGQTLQRHFGDRLYSRLFAGGLELKDVNGQVIEAAQKLADTNRARWMEGKSLRLVCVNGSQR